METLIQTWSIHNRIHLYFLDALSEEQWGAKPEKGKAVRDQFGHVHNVRLMWIKAAVPELLEGLSKLENASISETRAALTSSGERSEEMLARIGDPAGRVKNFKPHAAGFVGYLISHESHHRGMAELALRQTGLPLDDKTSYGLWEWGTR